jgi:hypothetical protein
MSGQVRHGPGLAVLFSRGMAALMRLLERLPSISERPKDPLCQHEKIPAITLPGTQQQIVQLLACMVLGLQQEVVHVH